MEISNKIPSVPRIPEGQAPREKIKPKSEIQQTAKGDRVQLSAQAQEMLAARKAIDQLPDVDLEKIAEIKAQLKEGRYRTDALKTASKMMTETLLGDKEK